jgi:putative hydrolase of the HAD superfamily
VIEAVLFDGDQTLWDFQKVMRTALLAVLDDIRAARPGVAAEALRIADLQADRNAVAQELLGGEFNLARLRQLGFRRSLDRLGRDGNGSTPADDELSEVLAASYFRYRDQDPALFDDTLPGLTAVRADFRIGLLSNGSRLPESIGLGDFFEVVVFAKDHRVTKPDRGIFEVVERQLHLAPSACVLIGDHPVNDVAGAKRSGWRAIWIDRQGDGTWSHDQAPEEKPDAVITSLQQLSGVLRQL